MRDRLAKQLAGQYGGTAKQEEEQGQYIDTIYDDTTSTYVPVPITQIMSDFSRNKYHQHGQDTGSVFLNSLLGYIPNSPLQPGAGGSYDPNAAAAAIAPAPAPAPVAAPTPAQQMVADRMNGSDGGMPDHQGYGGLGMAGYDAPGGGGGDGGGGGKA
jgi:hypothetical protein